MACHDEVEVRLTGWEEGMACHDEIEVRGERSIFFLVEKKS